MAKKPKKADKEPDFIPSPEMAEEFLDQADEVEAEEDLAPTQQVKIPQESLVEDEGLSFNEDAAGDEEAAPELAVEGVEDEPIGEAEETYVADEGIPEEADEAAAESPFEAEDISFGEGGEGEAEVAEEEPPAEEPPPEEPEEEPRPQAKVTVLTMVLLFLNVLAAIGFGFLFLLDYSKRQDWSYQIFRHDLLMQGLPLRSEEGPFSSGSRETVPRKKLNADQIKKAYSARGGKSVPEPFQAVDEFFRSGIRPEHLSPEILQDHFKEVGDPVLTLEDEIERLKTKLPGEIEEAAKEAVGGAKTVEEKRQLLAKLWLPLAANVKRVEFIDKTIKEAKDTDLDGLLLDIAQRRILWQILEPLEGFRPSAPQKRILEKIDDPDAVKLDVLAQLLQDRLNLSLAAKYNPDLQFGSDWANEDRESVEKRQYIAFLLCAIGEAKKLDGTPLNPKAADRASLLVGLYEYSLAVQALTNLLQNTEKAMLEAIRIDREGIAFMVDNQLKKTEGFVQRYQGEVAKVKDLLLHIKEAEFQLKGLQDRRELHKKVYEEREVHLKDITAKVAAARQETARKLEELRILQQQLFRAQVVLANAAEVNLQLFNQIRKAEQDLKEGRRP